MISYKNSSNQTQKEGDNNKIRSYTTEQIPDEYKCPINLEVMTDPVVAADGQTYQRESIREWLSGGNIKSPLNGSDLEFTLIYDNIFAKNEIRKYIDRKSVVVTEGPKNPNLDICIKDREETIKDLIEKIDGIKVSFKEDLKNHELKIENLKKENCKLIGEVFKLNEENSKLRNILSINGLSKLLQDNKPITNIEQPNTNELKILSNDPLGLKENIDVLNDSSKKDLDINSCLLENNLNILSEKENIIDSCETIYLTGHRSEVFCLLVLKNGFLASGSFNGLINIWSIIKGNYECIQNFYGHSCGSSYGVSSLVELNSGCLASTSDGDDSIKIWSNSKGQYECIKSINGHDDNVTCLIELKSGFLASASCDQSIKIWSNVKGRYKCIQTLNGHSHYVGRVIELTSGSLASASSDCSIKIWSNCKDNYKLIETITGHSGPVWCLIELKSGSLASGSADSFIKIWSYCQGNYECFQTLSGHEESVTSLVELKNLMLASSSFDFSIRIWKANIKGNYVCVQTLNVHSAPVLTLAEMKNGYLASASSDKSIRFTKLE